MSNLNNVPQSDYQIAELLRQRRRGWEYLLHAGALLMGINRLEARYGCRSSEQSSGREVTISEDELPYFLQNQVSELAAMVRSLGTCLDAGVMAETFGMPGIAGRPEKILRAASQVLELHEAMLLWAERLRRLRPPSEYGQLTENVACFADRPISELRAFVRQYAAQIDDLASAIAVGETIDIGQSENVLFPMKLSPNPPKRPNRPVRCSVSRLP